MGRLLKTKRSGSGGKGIARTSETASTTPAEALRNEEENARKRPRTSKPLPVDNSTSASISNNTTRPSYARKRAPSPPPSPSPCLSPTPQPSSSEFGSVRGDEVDGGLMFESSPQPPSPSPPPRIVPTSSVAGRGSKSKSRDREPPKQTEMPKKKPPPAQPPKFQLKLKPRSAIMEEDSDEEVSGGNRAVGRSTGYAGGRVEGTTLTEIPVLLQSSDEEEGGQAGSTVASNATTVTSNRSRRSSSVGISLRSSQQSDGRLSSVMGEKERHNRNDPDWLKFAEYVRNSPASAHERLSSDLLEAGTGTTKCTALLAKLICRTIADPEEEGNSQPKEFYQKCAATIIHAVLHLTICNDNSNVVVMELVQMLYTELKHFPISVLYSIGEHCLDYMRKEKDRDGCLPPRWIELFAKTVSIMIGKGDIKHETDIIDGKAYREYIVSGICRLKWTTANSAALIAVLREIPEIEDSDLKLVICQVRSCVKNIKASGFPPIVHQLILLAGSRFPLELLSISAEYFKADNTTTPLEVKQKRSALGTVVFHFLEAARHCEPLVKAVIKVVKSSFFDFGQVMSPFMLSVVLGLTTFDYAKAVIIEPLRNSIMKTFHSMHLDETSYWYQQTVGCSNDAVTECFKAVLESKSSEVEFMFDGLSELGIGLLNADLYQKQYPNTLLRCQKLGSYIIRLLVKNNEDQLPVMMKKLLTLSSRSIVHTECLANCLEMRTRQIIHPSVMGKTCEIIRHLPMMNSESASLIIKAMSTALQLSYMLMDQLMLILRKTIWKSVEARRTAAKVMIILLSNAKVVGDIPSSQYSESQRFSESQNQAAHINPDQLPDNQPLCIEIMALAKRCFSQQCEIKKELYLGFHSVVRRNPGICELLCCLLYKHGEQFLSCEEESEPAIDMKDVVEFPINDPFNSVIVKEELGFMIQCLSLVVRKSYQAFASIDDGPPEIVNQLEELVKKWVKAMLALTPEAIEIAAAEAVGNAGGSRPLDTVRYVETAFTIQALQIIEALIEFLNFRENREASTMVKRLFEKYKLLEPLLQKKKEVPTSKKGKGEKSKNKTNKDKEKENSNDDISIVDTASEVSGSVGTMGLKFKRPDAPKKLSYFHIFNLETLLDMLRKLYRSDPDKHPLTSVHRSSNEFEKMLLDTVKQKLASFKKKEPLHERSQRTEKIEETFADIAGCIWSGLCNLLDHEEIVIAADITQIRLEVVSSISEHLCSLRSSACFHMIKLFGDQVGDISYEHAFTKFFNSWRTLQAWIPANPEGEEDRNLHTFLFDILLSFSKPLSPDSTQCLQSRDVLSWLWTFMSSTSEKGNQQADFELADSVISCWLAFYIKARGFLEQPGQSQHDIMSLSKTVRATLGDNKFMEDTQLEIPHTKLWIINEDTASTALVKIIDFVEVVLGHMLTLLGKLKFQQVDDSEEGFKKADHIRERCFNMLNQVLGVSSNLVASAFPGGVFSTTMLRVIPQIFTVMTGFGEHLIELSKTRTDYSLIKGFVGPVNFIGKEFRNLVEVMIQHIESVQTQYLKEASDKAKASSSKSKKKAVKKAVMLPHSVKNQLGQDKRLIANMVYVMEKYDLQIITMSNKLKDHKGLKLIVGMKLTSARDYKIDGDVLTDAMRANRPRSVQDMTSVADDETVHPNADSPVPGPSTSKSSRARKGLKRKTAERETSHNE